MTTARLLSSPDAAHYLGMSRPKLYELSIPYVMLGRQRRYDVQDLDAYIDTLKAKQITNPRPKRKSA